MLLVEDSERLLRSIRKGLERSGYAVDAVSDGNEAFWLARSNAYDAIVLDIMLPGLDGLTIVRQLREQQDDTHILLLTARDTIEDRVRGLQMGADDYLVKPFAFAELLARVQALCRRGYGHKSSELIIGELSIDTARKTVVRAGKALELSRREFALLEYLVLRRGEVVTRSEIEAHIYNDIIEPMSNVVDSAMCGLRKKLSLPDRPALIHTRRGVGYVLGEDA